jgi:hypothetical protein
VSLTYRNAYTCLIKHSTPSFGYFPFLEFISMDFTYNNKKTKKGQLLQFIRNLKKKRINLQRKIYVLRNF